MTGSLAKIIRVFANGQGDRGLIRGRHTKDSKIVFVLSLHNGSHYKELINFNWTNPGREVSIPTPRCCSY